MYRHRNSPENKETAIKFAYHATTCPPDQYLPRARSPYTAVGGWSRQARTAAAISCPSNTMP
jgi:hypothetical protein